MNEIVRTREPETLPARAYCAPEYWNIERSQIWARTWVLVAHQSDFAAPGDYVTATVAGYPVLVIRGETGIGAFHNVCRHRASPVVLGECGHVERLTCPYHAWRYDFDGRLVNAPAMTIEKKDYGLFPMRCETWRGLVFVCLSDDVAPLEVWMKDVTSVATAYPLETMHLARRLTIEADINWKTYCDNYAEGWHVPTIHPGLNAAIDMASYRIDTLGDTLQKHSARARDGGMTDGAWLWRLPGLFLNIYDWGMNVEQLEPVGPGRIRLHYRFFFTDLDPARAEERARMMDWNLAVADEDIRICKRVQQNLEAGIYDRGRLSLVFENGVVQFQQMVEEAYRRAEP
jgi:phenylpropionate dioxygenase-like ring-hydroxylating dioxygenase large terminal subunit